ncbi:MAG TPA: hypothetical protein VGZ89_04310 [Xanthobacteraceae bacterium]|nr:hypothetical protein [Xanthobacteraceae bacterium]
MAGIGRIEGESFSRLPTADREEIFDYDYLERGLEALRGYRREYDERLKDWKQRPLHFVIQTQDLQNAHLAEAIGVKQIIEWAIVGASGNQLNQVVILSGPDSP